MKPLDVLTQANDRLKTLLHPSLSLDARGLLTACKEPSGCWLDVDHTTGQTKDVYGLGTDDVLAWVEPVVGVCMRGGGQKISVPLRLLTRREPLQRFTLYHIGFDEGRNRSLPSDLRAQMEAGYYGITKRPVAHRWTEHAKLAESNKGFALHTAWHHCLGKPGEVILRVCEQADTLPEIYALEERAVAGRTLMPVGLNVLPGGYAGIRAMQALGLTNKTKLGPEERERILTEMEQSGRAGPRAHYRRGHERVIASGRPVWVRPCFVALDKVTA